MKNDSIGIMGSLNDIGTKNQIPKFKSMKLSWNEVYKLPPIDHISFYNHRLVGFKFKDDYDYWLNIGKISN